MYLSELIARLTEEAKRNEKDIPVRFYTDTNSRGTTYDVDITFRYGVVGDKLEVIELQIEPLY